MDRQVRNICVALLLAGVAMGCGVGGTTDPPPPGVEWGDVVALNSVGKTVTQYDVGSALSSFQRRRSDKRTR